MKIWFALLSLAFVANVQAARNDVWALTGKGSSRNTDILRVPTAGTSLVPGTDNVFSLGSSSLKYANIYATNLTGVNTTASGQSSLTLQNDASTSLQISMFGTLSSGGSRGAWLQNGTEAITISNSQLVGFGTTSPATKIHISSGILTQDGTTAYHTFAMNTSSPTAVSGKASIWAVNEGGSAEMKVIDGAGNITKISPHDPVSGRWVFDSYNVKTGVRVRVDMEKLIRAVEVLTGEDIWEESRDSDPKRNKK